VDRKEELMGLGLRPAHFQEFLAEKPRVPLVEVITDNFLNVGGRPLQVLTEIATDYPLAMHGVGLSIGSPDPLRPEYLKSLKNIVDRFRPKIVSDHLSWSRLGLHNSHDLLPIRYDKKTMTQIVDKVHQVQEFLGRSLVLENPSAYIAFDRSDFTEAEFLAELSLKTDCGILFDLNNLVVNANNLGTDIEKYFDVLADARVEQFHLAGHSREMIAGFEFRIDTHDSAPNDETRNLFDRAQRLWPRAIPLLEWDDKLPAWHDFKTELVL
jgi:uncharacterized protein